VDTRTRTHPGQLVPPQRPRPVRHPQPYVPVGPPTARIVALTPPTTVQLDILYFAETNPEILTVGCNTGKVDTYLTVDPSVLTNGAYTASQVAKNPLCFATEFLAAELPGLTGLTTAVLSPLTSAINRATSSLGGCAAIGSVNTSALAVCPGLSNYGGPTGPVAPGAIQS